jgi:hypothetical protein
VKEPTKSTKAIMAGDGSSENSRSRPVATPIYSSMHTVHRHRQQVEKKRNSDVRRCLAIRGRRIVAE